MTLLLLRIACWPALAGCFLVVCAASHAQGPRERPRYVLQALDLNHDGTLSASEIEAAPATLRALDRNNDGELTADELQPPRNDAGASPDQLAQQLMSFDRNGDGVLTSDELPERMQPVFRHGDVNGDCELTPDEIRSMVLHAGAPNGRRTSPGRAEGMMRLDSILNGLDLDHDAVISESEMNAASTSLLVLDVNHDGTISAAEMPVRQQSPSERVSHVLGEFDSNGDGKLSKDELPDGLRARFDQADTNRDGSLDHDELLALFSAMQGAQALQGSRN